MVITLPSHRHLFHRQGFTLIELMVVITVIAILAGISIPAITMVQEMARKARCASNQRGIFAALIAYREGNNHGIPDARFKLGDKVDAATAIASGDDCARYTSGIFEIVAATMRDNLPVGIFRCPSQTSLSYMPHPDISPSSTRADTTWGWDKHHIPYACDWSAPLDAGAARIIIADRDVMNHKDKHSIVCYADGHTNTLERAKDPKTKTWMSAQGSNQTMGLIKSLTDVVVYNDDAKGSADGPDDDRTPDNIYDNFGDSAKGSEERTRTPGGGDARRTFVK